jgi:glycogen synthase
VVEISGICVIQFGILDVGFWIPLKRVVELEKLRILVISNLYPPQMIGGYERAIADCARLLYQRGHEVLVLTSNAEAYTTSYTNPAIEPPVDRCLLLGGV